MLGKIVKTEEADPAPAFVKKHIVDYPGNAGILIEHDRPVCPRPGQLKRITAAATTAEETVFLNLHLYLFRTL
jgi:hypothetical protein